MHATNLSASGACLHLGGSLPVGDPVALRIRVPGGDPIAVRGRVSWCEAPPADAAARFLEAGVRFEIVPDLDRDRLADFLASLGR